MANLVHFIPLLTFTTILLMLLNKAHSSDSLSFTFDSFRPNQNDLILQGDSQILSSNILQLTREIKATVGRALYIAPVHLWEKSTSKVASFETKFTFVLNSSRGTQPSDGIAFFIAPIDTTIPPGSSGGLLGLFSPPKTTTALINTSSNPLVEPNQVVAVEFDTFTGNSWDPNYRHIGIDVNTIQSAAVTRWVRREGAKVSVHITYTPATRILRVESFNPGTSAVSLTHEVDLKTVLPEWVRIGFSASTGDETQSHSVLSWSFSSKFESNSEANYKDDDMYNIVRDVTDVDV